MCSDRLPPSEDAAKQLLREAALHLKDLIGNATIALWDGERLNVASTRNEKTLELRSKGVSRWTSEDYDFVFFKCMTTMGDVNTFKFVLPRFLLACSTYPEYYGWASESHVLLSKCAMLNFADWKKHEAHALLNAVEKFALFEWSISLSPDEAVGALQQSERDLIGFVDAKRREL